MDIQPILAAHYFISYQTADFSEGWGRWSFEPHQDKKSFFHNPNNKLPNGEHDIASVYMPVIGVYDSADPDLCEYHVLLAKASGVQAFIVDWYGPDAPGDHVHNETQLSTLFKTAELLDFKIALCFNDACCFPPFQENITDRQGVVGKASSMLAYAKEKYFVSSAYLKIDEKPVLTTRNCGRPGTEMENHFIHANEWDTILENSRQEILLIQNYQPQMKGINFPDWPSVAPSVAIYFSDYDTDETFWEKSAQAMHKNKNQFVSGVVTPGYDDRAIGGSCGRNARVFSRRQGEKYSATWEDALTHGAKFIQIGTWNDFREGNGIEPVKEIILHKTAAVPGSGYRELIATREYSVRLTQKKLWPLPALFLPERLYRLRKSGAPATRGDRIRLYLLEGDVTGSTLGLEHAGV
ncbi:hypothetical protein K8S19_11355 [bacterium]|nr:hypothetical protein [bacterium]